MASKKTRRIRLLGLGAAAMIAATTLVVFSFQDTFSLFRSPSQILAEAPGPERLLRIGGMVAEGSVVRGRGEEVAFDVTDGAAQVTVTYVGILPDLFREGQGVVAQGKMQGETFVASEVLAKHDENYMPREVIDAMKAQGTYRAPSLVEGASATPADAAPEG